MNYLSDRSGVGVFHWEMESFWIGKKSFCLFKLQSHRNLCLVASSGYSISLLCPVFSALFMSQRSRKGKRISFASLGLRELGRYIQAKWRWAWGLGGPNFLLAPRGKRDNEAETERDLRTWAGLFLEVKLINI